MSENNQINNSFSETIFEINWKDLIHNIEYIKGRLKKETKLMLMVKASAYGHGATDFARKIEPTKLVDYLGVATLDEGVALRKAGVELSIMVQNPNPKHWRILIENCLEPVIYNFENLNSFQAYLKDSKLSNEPGYPIHLKLDTGMNRFGFKENQMNELMESLSQPKLWRVQSVMSHLSSAGDLKAKNFTLDQIHLFENCIEKLKPYLNDQTFFHILNTSGIENFKKFQMNMVRLGIGLYGASTNSNLKKDLVPIGKLITQIAAVKKVDKTDFIGYNRKGKVKTKSNIAILTLGYADGFPRKMGNGNWSVEIKGELFPIIGNVCMDLCMVDLGDRTFNIGEKVTVFGGTRSIFDYAKAQDIITYEALTNLGERVKRVFV